MSSWSSSYHRYEFDSQILIQISCSHRSGPLPCDHILFILYYEAKTSYVLHLILKLAEIQVLYVWVHTVRDTAHNRLIKTES